MQTACADSTPLRTPEGLARAPAPVANRRHALAGLAAAPLALAGGRVLTAAAGASSSTGEAADPHPAWYAEWKAAIDYMDGPAGWEVEDDLRPAVYHRALELEDLIGRTPAQTLAGALCQLRMLRHWCTPASMPNETLDAALENALATVEQLAGRAAHV